MATELKEKMLRDASSIAKEEMQTKTIEIDAIEKYKIAPNQ